MTEKRVISIASPLIAEEEIEAVVDVLKSGMLSQGSQVAKFEDDFASYIGTKYAVAVSSGTTALHVALLTCGIAEGDEVITTPFTFIATVNAILYCGAKPKLVDVEEDTFNINPNLIEENIIGRTKVIMPVHLYGYPCEMRSIIELSKKYKLHLVEDACQAVGAEYGGQKTGSFGIGCFSFYPTKNMTTCEGGMITTDDMQVAKQARMIRNHGQDRRYVHERLGYNYRMTDMAAAMGVCQLEKLESLNRKRLENAMYLTEALSPVKGVITPCMQQNIKHVFHQYTIRIRQDFPLTRDELKKKLEEAGIYTGIYYPLPVHMQPFYNDLGYDCSLPVSEKLAREVLSLPVHPKLAREDLDRIINEIQSC